MRYVVHIILTILVFVFASSGVGAMDPSTARRDPGSLPTKPSTATNASITTEISKVGITVDNRIPPRKYKTQKHSIDPDVLQNKYIEKRELMITDKRISNIPKTPEEEKAPRYTKYGRERMDMENYFYMETTNPKTKK